MRKNTIGIVGSGFVGNAVKEGMKHACDVFVYDKFKPELSNVKNVQHLLDEARIVFVCVPTPMLKSGKCDTSIVERCVQEIADLLPDHKGNGRHVIVIKSTVPPGTTEKLQQQHKAKLYMVFNPEFLTEKSSVDDFKKQDRIVLGGSEPAVNPVANLYEKAYPKVPILKTAATVAETVKYTTNCFLATKVSFANELHQMCEKLDISYERVIDIATHDRRLGKSHWQVPGPMPAPNGQLRKGFSGSCFVKDINAFLAVAKDLGVDPKVMQAAWEKNLEVRPERDWEELIGRAVSEEKK